MMDPCEILVTSSLRGNTEKQVFLNVDAAISCLFICIMRLLQSFYSFAMTGFILVLMYILLSCGFCYFNKERVYVNLYKKGGIKLCRQMENADKISVKFIILCHTLFLNS